MNTKLFWIINLIDITINIENKQIKKFIIFILKYIFFDIYFYIYLLKKYKYSKNHLSL